MPFTTYKTQVDASTDTLWALMLDKIRNPDKYVPGVETVTVVQEFGPTSIEREMVAHDLGGPAAYAFTALHPDRALSMTLFETPFWGVVPEDVPDLTQMFWHLKFHQDVDLATTLIAPSLSAYLDHFYRDFAANPEAIPPADRDAYLRAYAAPGALRASLMLYHAIPQLAVRMAELSHSKLTIPVAAYGGAQVMGAYVEKAARHVADDVEGGVFEACGHWLPEENPTAAPRSSAAPSQEPERHDAASHPPRRSQPWRSCACHAAICWIGPAKRQLSL